MTAAATKRVRFDMSRTSILHGKKTGKLLPENRDSCGPDREREASEKRALSRKPQSSTGSEAQSAGQWSLTHFARLEPRFPLITRWRGPELSRNLKTGGLNQRRVDDLLMSFEIYAHRLNQTAVRHLSIGPDVKLNLERVIAGTPARGWDVDAKARSSITGLLVDIGHDDQLPIDSVYLAAVTRPCRFEKCAQLQAAANIRPHLRVAEIDAPHATFEIASLVDREFGHDH